jgi:hypothetical protein
MAKSGGGLFHPVPKGVAQEKGNSAPQNTSVGSGSRPTKSKMPIESSAPMDPHTLGRGTPSALK